MTVSRVVCVALTGTAVAFSSTACTGGSEPDTAPPPASGTPTTQAAPASQAAPPSEAPDGWSTIGGPANGLRISIPPEWVDIAISSGEAAAGLDRLGLKGANRENLRKSIAQLEAHKGVFAVMTASTRTSFATNVNALCTASPAVSIDQLKAGTRAGLGQLGAKNIEITDATVGGRPGIRTTYRLDSALGAVTGYQAQVPDDDRTCTVTVTAKQGAMPANADEITNTLELL